MRSPTTTFYNRFAFFYPLVDLMLKGHKKRLAREIDNLPRSFLLDIGVGSGSQIKYYRKHYGVGIDNSEAMLKAAQRQCDSNMQLIQMDGQQLHFENETFDVVIASHVIAVVDSPERLLSEVLRVLKPGGQLFLLNHFTPDNWLRYADRVFQRFSARFHFKAVFRMEQVAVPAGLTLVKEITLPPASYFKLLIYRKSED